MSTDAREGEQRLDRQRRADETRAVAAEHRARAHELRAGVRAGDGEHGTDSDAFLEAGIEEVLAEIAELRAAGRDDEADALRDGLQVDAETHEALSAAAIERARAREDSAVAATADQWALDSEIEAGAESA